MLHLEIKLETLFKLVGILILGLVLYWIQDIFWILFITFIFVSALNPIVKYFEQKRYSRLLIVSLFLVVFIAFVGLAALVLIPSMIYQFEKLLIALPTAVNQSFYSQLGINHWISFEQFQQIYHQTVDSVSDWFRNASFNLLQVGIGLLGAFVTAITITVLTFYSLLDHDKIIRFLVSLFPNKSQSYVQNLIIKTELRLGIWMRGQISVMLIMGLLTYICLISFGVESALALALIAALMEIVPFVGPALTSIPAILIASGQSTYHVFITMVLFFVLQQLEGNLVVPKIMNKAVGLHPIIVILAVTIGAQQGGPLGALLAIPLSTVGFIFFQEWQDRRRMELD